MMQHKEKIITSGLGVLGVTMILIGITSGALPPALTGIGFLLLLWNRV